MQELGHWMAGNFQNSFCFKICWLQTISLRAGTEHRRQNQMLWPPKVWVFGYYTERNPLKRCLHLKVSDTQSSHKQGLASPLFSWKCSTDICSISCHPYKYLFRNWWCGSGRSRLIGDQLAPSSAVPRGTGCSSSSWHQTSAVWATGVMDALSTHHLLFRWGKGGSCQALPPLGRNGSFFLVFLLNKNKTL